jgi:hypothetical protein
MRIVKNDGLIKKTEIGNDNVLLFWETPSGRMPFLVKREDFDNRVTDRDVQVFPILRDYLNAEYALAYLARLDGRDYDNLMMR